MPATYIVLGAGVIGLTTALELQTRHPNSKIIIAAKFLPGDRDPTYTSPWAGANWSSVATDNGPQENRDRITYLRFKELAARTAECGIYPMDLHSVYENEIEDAEVLSPATGKIWFDSLVGGVKMMKKEELPEGTKFGFDMSTFVIDTQVYLPW